jgi:ribosome recycling factor
MNSDQIQSVKGQLEGVIEFYQEELKNIRTGRANASVVEDIEVDYYGTKSPLKQAASISTQDARTIVITPWSKDTLVNIEKAINDSDLGVNPVNDGKVVRLCFPPLTEERREEMVKVVGKKTEEARIKVRKVREEMWDDIQKKEKNGEISEDDKFKGKDTLQQLVDEYNKKIEELNGKKEEDIRQV